MLVVVVLLQAVGSVLVVFVLALQPVQLLSLTFAENQTTVVMRVLAERLAERVLAARVLVVERVLAEWALVEGPLVEGPVAERVLVEGPLVERPLVERLRFERLLVERMLVPLSRAGLRRLLCLLPFSSLGPAQFESPT